AGQGRGQCEGTRHRRLSPATGLPHHGAAVTSSRPRSANSPAVATSVTAPATPANRTLALSSPATVRFTAQAQRVAGRSTGCRAISSPPPGGPHRRARTQPPVAEIGGPAAPHYGKQYRQHRQRVAHLAPGPQQARSANTSARAAITATRAWRGWR